MGAGTAAIHKDFLDVSQCSPGGYGRSKWASEKIIQRASSRYGADVHVLRIGQIVGDTKFGIWNDTEAIPLMIRSALACKSLPKLDVASIICSQ